MLRRSTALAFYMKVGRMYVDYKVVSRDHKRGINVEEAVVDPACATTVLPLSWLEQLRSPTLRLPTGYYTEEPVFYDPATNRVAAKGSGIAGKPSSLSGGSSASMNTDTGSQDGPAPNAIKAGPVVFYVVGQPNPIVLYPYFVPDSEIRYAQAIPPPPPSPTLNYAANPEGTAAGQTITGGAPVEVDLRLGMDAIEQCGLFNELRPGGYLYRFLPTVVSSEGNTSSSSSSSAKTPAAGAAPLTLKQLQERLEPLQTKLKRDYGMKDARIAHSPLVPRPWTRMKYMFIDELQRGPRMTEFVGFNPRSGTPWRFSQHNKFFRQGIWREMTRRNEMNDGVHAHSSWQKSPQQAVPDVNFMAPYP